MIEMYVKLISKEHEWFDVGTEVFEAYMDGYNAKNKPLKRMTVEEYKIWEKSGNILGFGLRNGSWRTELCPIEEFDIVYTEEQT
jgi:hypothetical protein